jgi:hypothetical protein
MSNADYHADFSRVSASMLKVFLDSRREYEARYVTRTMEAEPPSDPMQLGSLAHAMLLEPHTLSEFVQVPADVLSKSGSRAGKAWEQFCLDNAGKTLVKWEDFDAARKMVASIKAKCGAWFDSVGEPEKPLLWNDDATGLPCKAKPDYLIVGRQPIICVDVKTAANAMPGGFRDSVKRYRYYLQESHYRNGIGAANPTYGVNFYFVVVQNKPPYQCRVYEIPYADSAPPWSRIDMEYSHNLYRRTMQQIAECYQTNDWSDPGEDEVTTLYYESCQ